MDVLTLKLVLRSILTVASRETGDIYSTVIHWNFYNFKNSFEFVFLLLSPPLQSWNLFKTYLVVMWTCVPNFNAHKASQIKLMQRIIKYFNSRTFFNGTTTQFFFFCISISQLHHFYTLFCFIFNFELLTEGKAA